MVALVLRIVFRSLVTLFLLTACVFFALHLTGDPARIMLGDGADATALAAFRAQWGLDKPLWEQFLVYLQKFITLDMGTSYLTGVSECLLANVGLNDSNCHRDPFIRNSCRRYRGPAP